MKQFKELVNELVKRAEPAFIPDFVKPVCIVTGTPYEMGFQLGLESGAMSINQTIIAVSRMSAMRAGSDIMADAARFEEIVAAQAPDILEMWHGTADALHLPYEVMLLQNIPNLGQPPVSRCSSLSAWGSATQEGRMINAINSDGGAFTPTSFGVTMVLYPNDGNISVNNGGYNSNFALNDKGLVNMATAGGWDGRDGDVGYGTPAVLSTMELNLHCSNVKEALHLALDVHRPTGSPENLHFADVSGDACLLEMTCGHHSVRCNGDNGEEDYLLATNFFLTPEMQSSKPQNLARTNNAVSRYRTEQELLRSNHGQITLEVLNAVLTCRDYFDGQTWVRNVWDEEYSKWTPEKRSYQNDTYMQCMADPGQKTAYFRQGKGCEAAACVPGSVAQYSRIVLEPTPFAMAEQAVTDAKREIFAAATRVETGRVPLTDRVRDRMNFAKKCIWEGENHKAIALLAEDTREQMLHLSTAVTLYCKAQVLAAI